jgi:hypothetical protein
MPPETDPRVATQDTTDQPGFKYGHALVEQAKAVSKNFTATFYEDQRFALGESQWPTPASYRAWIGDRWKNRGVRNYTWSTIQQKLAVCLDAEPSIRAEPLTELVSYEQRQDIASAVRHELDRLRWREYIEDVMIDGSILGKGLIHVYPMRDPFTGMYELNLELVDPTRFYPDPAKTRLSECRYVVYEPDMDMATIRKFFPDTYQLVKPESKPIGKMGQTTYTRTEDELIYGATTGEFAINRDGILTDRRADVALIFIKDPTVIQEVKTVLDKEPAPGLKCSSCGTEFDKDQAIFEPAYDSRRPMCPTCGSTEVQPVMLAPQFSREIEKTRKYPNGRLIAKTKDALLYDGPNEYRLREVFPFAEYTHNRVTRRFWGYGDVALLKEVQRAMNKNMAQAIDNLRMCGNAPLEVPAEVPAYRHLGNRPGDQIPCPAPFMGMARYLNPASYNVSLHQIVDSSLKRDFQEIGGVSDVSFGLSPSSPTSGIEVQARQRAASTRTGLHLQKKNQCESDLANIVWQMMNQFYREPRSYQKMLPTGEVEAIVLEVSTLPVDVYVKVSASIDRQEKDNLFGQNLVGLVNAGQVGFYPDLMLPLMGAQDRELVKEIAAREEQRQRALAAQAPAEALPPGAGAESPAPAPPPTGTDQALAAEGV